MKENKYLEIIKNTLADSSLIGDDCAFLDKDIVGSNGLYVTHDSLVEDVHFSLKTISAYELGQKSVQVNLSDLAAMCAKPLCITISLSLPKNIGEDFVSDFYKGINEACLKYGVKVAGGDLTGSEKVFVSICAIGKKTSPCNISRSCAKENDVVLVSGFHGDSAAGLKLLQSGKKEPKSLVNAHLLPEAEIEKSEILSKYCEKDFAMMDTSDGLGDALFKIADASNVSIDVDFSSIPVSKTLIETFPELYKKFVLWGGEDYKLLCCVNPLIAEKLIKKGFVKIGKVTKPKQSPQVLIKDGENIIIVDKEMFEKQSFDHFGD